MNPRSRVDASLARSLASNAFEDESGAVVYVDRAPREPGTVSLGPETVEIERPAVVVFRDELPGANWMHNCSYALVDLETGDVLLTTAADRPPRFGLLPETWVVAADPDERADLVPPQQESEERDG